MDDELHTRRSRRRAWPWGVLIATVLIGLTTGRSFLEQTFPWLRGPAPSWMGLLVLAIPVVAGVVYVASQVSKARRRRRGWAAGEGRTKGDRDSGCGGGGSGCSGGDSGCGGGHGGCGGGSGCGGGGCGGGGH